MNNSTNFTRTLMPTFAAAVIGLSVAIGFGGAIGFGAAGPVDAAARGGNAQLEWKVEAAESPFGGIGGLKVEMAVIEGGNVEFEWKVEEGES